MGVYYSSTAGYGLALTELPAVFAGAFEGPYIEPREAAEWLQERNCPSIRYERLGDHMSGEYVHLFYWEGTYADADMYNDLMVELEGPPTAPYMYAQFDKLKAALGVTNQKVGWKLVFNVS